MLTKDSEVDINKSMLKRKVENGTQKIVNCIENLIDKILILLYLSPIVLFFIAMK